MYTAVGHIVKIKVDLTYLNSLSLFSQFKKKFHLALLNNLFTTIENLYRDLI